MCTLKIKNIGPIKKIEMAINKVTFLLGPQSSGKSTVAKVLCHCQWIEKRCYTNFEEESAKFIKDNNFVDGFVEYYRLDGYFSDDSYIRYEGNFITLEYAEKKLTISKSEVAAYEYPKLCYVPAERNLVAAIPNLRKYNDTNDLILYFLYDWFEARDYLKKLDLEQIVERHVRYKYEESSSSDLILDGDASEIEMKNASSGLQSVVPLMMVSTYILQDIYRRYKPLSSEQMLQLNKATEVVKRVTDELNVYLKQQKETGNVGELRIKVDEANDNPILRAILERDPRVQDLMSSLNKEFFYKRSDIYIEEPEQNLFPDAQQRYVYWLMKQIKDPTKQHSVFVTTHSPFVLFSLNNCLMGGLTGDKLSDAEKADCLSRESWIDPLLVTVYEIHDGELLRIQEPSGLLMQNYLNRAYGKINAEFMTMLDHYED